MYTATHKLHTQNLSPWHDIDRESRDSGVTKKENETDKPFQPNAASNETIS